MKFKTLVFLLFIPLVFNAQTDSTKTNMVKYVPEYRFKDGLYVDFENFKTNNPIDKSKIIAPNLDHKDYNFIATLVQEKEISIYDDMGNELSIKPKNLWGFCDNGNVYVKIDEDFSRLGYVGSLCHFVADKVVYNNAYNSPYYSPYSSYNYNRYPYGQPTSSTVEMRQYILDMETGKVSEFTLEAVEVALMKDPQLYDEFMELNRKKKRQRMFFYIRKFNERNPLLMPKS